MVYVLQHWKLQLHLRVRQFFRVCWWVATVCVILKSAGFRTQFYGHLWSSVHHLGSSVRHLVVFMCSHVYQSTSVGASCVPRDWSHLDIEQNFWSMVVYIYLSSCPFIFCSPGHEGGKRWTVLGWETSEQRHVFGQVMSSIILPAFSLCKRRKAAQFLFPNANKPILACIVLTSASVDSPVGSDWGLKGIDSALTTQ